MKMEGTFKHIQFKEEAQTTVRSTHSTGQNPHSPTHHS